MTSNPAVLVVVLGDLGRSPRISQHIRELLTHGYSVECIAYKGKRIQIIFLLNMKKIPL